MNKKWIVVSIMLIGILLLAGMNAAEASGQISQEQYYNGYDPYTPDGILPIRIGITIGGKVIDPAITVIMAIAVLFSGLILVIEQNLSRM